MLYKMSILLECGKMSYHIASYESVIELKTDKSQAGTLVCFCPHSDASKSNNKYQVPSWTWALAPKSRCKFAFEFSRINFRIISKQHTFVAVVHEVAMTAVADLMGQLTGGFLRITDHMERSRLRLSDPESWRGDDGLLRDCYDRIFDADGRKKRGGTFHLAVVVGTMPQCRSLVMEKPRYQMCFWFDL
jgi:hypothetical protein